MALASLTQDDYGAGIYRGRKAPADSVYDAVNALVNDEGLLVKRGGSEYYSTGDAGSAAKTRLHALFMTAVAADRVLLAPSADGSLVYALDGSLAPVGIGIGEDVWGRVVSMFDLAIIPVGTSNEVFLYGGSLKSSVYSTGTVTVTDASTTVTGSGTSWSANADAGMILTSGGGFPGIGVVKSVDSDTQITLMRPWNDGTAAGASYSLRPKYAFSISAIDIHKSADRVFFAATSRYLLCAGGNRVFFTDDLDSTAAFLADDYHEIPAGASIIGLESRGTSAWVFTTAGVWEIANLFLDPVDAYGNIQHTVQQINKDVVLWDDLGIAGWAGALVVPALDDVYLAAPDFSLTPLTARIRPLYREYVEAGYKPGFAAVHRGHYFLPIMNGATLVDTLVCRLDREAAWTRWSGHASSPAYATLSSGSASKLLGIGGLRVTDLSSTFDPSASNALDADGEDFDATIITRDYPTGGNQHGFVQRVRARYELVDGGTPDPAVAVAYSSDQDAGVFTTLTEKGLQGGGAGGVASDGAKYSWWLVGKRRERIRFRFTVTGACASFVLRSIELLLRPTGKQ